MKPLFSELVEINELQSLCEIFSKLTGFATAILDMEGNVLTATSWREICTGFHRKYPATAEACHESDTALGKLPSPGAKYNIYRCKNGLIDVSVPIMVENLQVGKLFTGQFLFDSPDVEFFRRQAAAYGFDETSYLEAVLKVPLVSEEQLDQVMEFLCRLAEMIGRMGLGNQRLREANEELLVHRQKLERRVEERTAELSAKNEQLRREIDERKHAEKTLRESEEKFRVLAETSPTAIFLYQGDMIIYANPATERLFGYTGDELLRMRFWDWAHEDFKDMVRISGLARLRGETVPSRYESRFVTKGSEDRWLVVSAGLIEYHGRPAGVASFLDITESKRVEGQLRDSLAEKEVLLKEIHHRVKNNLQIISTLLELQADTIHNDILQKSLKDCQDRIKAMALIHEKLYQSSDLVCIDFWEYIESLVGHLLSSYIDNPQRIVMKVDIGDIQMGIDRAIPYGLIINELVSNAIKHAFPNGRSGEIAISLRADDRGVLTLTVADNGVGLPPGLDFRNTETLGLQLVNLLTKQLWGELSLLNKGGATFIISFKS
jgi:PAS domain S-box-containing protein